MDRLAVFVDAGYFVAAGANAAFNKNTPRKQISLKSPEVMIADLSAKVASIANGLPLLRIYWYDAMPGPRLSLEQTTIATLNGVKLRLGALNSAGEQKGVDSLIVTDVIDLARNKAIAEAVIISGDEDLRIAVQIAQSFGVRVHILAAGDASKNVSPSLRMEADSVHALDGLWFTKHLDNSATSTVSMPPAAPVIAPAAPTAAIEPTVTTVVTTMIAAFTPPQLAHLVQHFTTNKTVPPEFDRPLIAQVAATLNRQLTGTELRTIRGHFITAVRKSQKPA